MNNTILAIKQRFGIIGMTKSLDHAISTAMRVAATDLSVLISGESGVGKEIFSRIIHSLSSRKHNQFIAINCGAIPEGTINSELFGHEKGSFTGAMGERKGYFETVDGGTIFLDEIGEMPLDTQAFLLRVLESGEFIRVGASKTLKTNVRVIAATNVNLLENVQRGKFREDLYYRLSTVPIKVPSLKERREDIHLLFRKFAYDFSEKYHTPPIQLDSDAAKVLENYPWPGNIRELKNLAEQISVLSESRLLSAEQLLQFMPQLGNRNLPIGFSGAKDFGNGYEEREILYKLLFDMKNDLNDLKSLVFELIKSNNLQMPNIPAGKLTLPVTMPASNRSSFAQNASSDLYANTNMDPNFGSSNQPYIYDRSSTNDFDETVEVVDENLNMNHIEKDAIVKALKKHNGRRREAADDLGMSERTLYRKIKQYDIDN
ncbi:MAG: sigma-54 interaction domain-containing protein [Saprospiraceae bacterium]